jgi:hypothetical protein
MSDSGGWLWLLIDVVLVALLAAGLIYGTVMWRHRRRNGRRDEATKELYRRGAERE